MTLEFELIAASYSGTPSDTLTELATSEYRIVREAVANHPDTPASVLTKLAGDDYWETRAAVAANPNTPADVLEELAGNEDWYTRFRVAQNPAAPAEVLGKLAQDVDGHVRNAAFRHICGRTAPTGIEVRGVTKSSDNSLAARAAEAQDASSALEQLQAETLPMPGRALS